VLREAGNGSPELREVFAPHAFAQRADHRDRNIVLLAGHDFTKPLASFGSGTLDLRDTEDALIVEARLGPVISKANYVADLLAGIRAGLTVGLSPGFRIAPGPGAELVKREGNVIRREVHVALLEEISIVTRPAYPDAQIEARSWTLDATAARQVVPHHLNRWRL
jgi:hypothetical protein